MKPKELREKTKKDLEELLKEKREKLFKLRLELAQGKLKNYREIRKVKREIAQILTILREKCQEKD